MRRIVQLAGVLGLSFVTTVAMGQKAPPAPAAAAPAAAEPAPAAPAEATTPAAAAPAPQEASPAAAAPQPAAKEGAKESEEEPFGKAGVINIASDIDLNFQHTGYSAPSGGTAPPSATTYMLGPAADFFVVDNLSVGAMLQFGRVLIVPGTTVDVIALEPRVGYHIPFVPGRLGLWPRASFSYDSMKDKTTGITEKTMGIGLFVPLLIHPAEHFHIGIGPYIDTDLSAKVDGVKDAKATTMGLRMEIAGWWKL